MSDINETAVVRLKDHLSRIDPEDRPWVCQLTIHALTTMQEQPTLPSLRRLMHVVFMIADMQRSNGINEKALSDLTTLFDEAAAVAVGVPK